MIGREPKPMCADYEAAVRDHWIDLLYAGGALAALIELVLEPDHLLIENLAVAPDLQKRGYGRRLLAHAEAVAAGAGYGELRLYTNELFAENVRLYRRLSYRIARQQPFAGGEIVHMSKAVTGNR